MKKVKLDIYSDAPKRWQKYYLSFLTLRREVLKKIFESDNEKELLDKLNKKEQEAFRSVKEPHKYLAYHIALASGTGPISSPLLDFKGKYSLMKIYKKFQERLK